MAAWALINKASGRTCMASAASMVVLVRQDCRQRRSSRLISKCWHHAQLMFIDLEGCMTSHNLLDLHAVHGRNPTLHLQVGAYLSRPFG